MIRVRGVAVVVFSSAEPLRLGRWYRHVFDARVIIEQPRFVGLDLGGVSVFIEPAAAGCAPGPGGTRPHFTVASVRVALEELELGGAEVVLPLTDVGEEWIAACADPEGNVFGLIAKK